MSISARYLSSLFNDLQRQYKKLELGEPSEVVNGDEKESVTKREAVDRSEIEGGPRKVVSKDEKEPTANREVVDRNEPEHKVTVVVVIDKADDHDDDSWDEDEDYGMKRGADRDMGSPLKRARSLGHELRILIPSRVAGSIIGKGGNNITRLRSENKATISVPDCPGPERLITIAADDQEVTLNVLSQVVPLTDDSSKDRNSRGGSVSDTSENVEVRLLFHHTQVGCIIGKGGAKIKELRETTSAQIKIYGSCCPRSTDRVVAVSGSVDTVLNAVKQIVALVNESPIKGVSEQYDPHNYDELYAPQYGGFGESRGGGYGGGDRYRPMGGSGGRMMSGPRGSSRGRSGNRQRGGSSDTRSNGVSRSEDYDAEFDDERTTTQVTIPKEYAGAIIGKGGTRIRRIRAESGATITIDDALPGATDRIITISGVPGQIRMAQYLLQSAVKQQHDTKVAL